MIGLDTTAIIDLFRGNKKIRKVIENIDQTIHTTIINYQELIFGLDPKNEKHKIEKEFYNEFFEKIILLPLDKKSINKSSEIFWELKLKGKMIGKLDSMIAGILLANGITRIITRNAKHFSRIKGMKAINY